MVVGTHVVVDLTVGPRQAQNLIPRKECQMLFLEPQMSYSQNSQCAFEHGILLLS